MKIGPLEIRWHRFEIFSDVQVMRMLSPQASWLACFLACAWVRMPFHRRRKVKLDEKS